MCLHHIRAHERNHFLHALPLKPTPTCFTKQCRTSRTQEFEYTWWSGLQIMLNVQYNTRYMSRVNYIEHVQNKSLIFFLVRIVMRRFTSHIFDTFNKMERQVKPKRRQENDQTWFIYFQKCPFWACIKKNQHIHILVHGHSSRSTFGLHLVRGPRLSKLIFQEVGPWKLDHELRPLKKALVHGLTSWSIV